MSSAPFTWKKPVDLRFRRRNGMQNSGLVNFVPESRYSVARINCVYRKNGYESLKLVWRLGSRKWNTNFLQAYYLVWLMSCKVRSFWMRRSNYRNTKKSLGFQQQGFIYMGNSLQFSYARLSEFFLMGSNTKYSIMTWRSKAG